MVLVSVQGVQNGGPILNLRGLRGPPFLVYALSQLYELCLVIVFSL